jgi:hypothetical protein
MLFGETVAVYCENHMEHTNTICGQNAELWYVKVGGTYSDHNKWVHAAKPNFLSAYIYCEAWTFKKHFKLLSFPPRAGNWRMFVYMCKAAPEHMNYGGRTTSCQQRKLATCAASK